MQQLINAVREYHEFMATDDMDVEPSRARALGSELAALRVPDLFLLVWAKTLNAHRHDGRVLSELERVLREWSAREPDKVWAELARNALAEMPDGTDPTYLDRNVPITSRRLRNEMIGYTSSTGHGNA